MNHGKPTHQNHQLGEHIEHLPDRSNLSQLYPQVGPGNTAATPNNTTDISNTAPKPAKWLAILISARAILPVLIAVIAIEYLIQNIKSSNIFFFLPLIMLGSVGLGFYGVLTYRSIVNKLSYLDINAAVFFNLYACLVILYMPSIYHVTHLTQSFLINQILFSLLLICSSIFIGTLLLRVVFDELRSNRTKLTYLLILGIPSLILVSIHLLAPTI